MASNILSSSPTQIQYFIDSSLPAKQVLSVTNISGAAQTGVQLILSPSVPAPVSVPGAGLLSNPAPLDRTAGFIITDVIVRNVTALATALGATVLAGPVAAQVAATTVLAPSALPAALLSGNVTILSGGVSTNSVVLQGSIITVNETGATTGTRQYIVMGVAVAL